MAHRFRSLAASAVVLVMGYVISPAPPTYAHTGSAELPVSLVINDICTLDTGSRLTRVACVAGGQYRVYSGEYFAKLRAFNAKASASRSDIVEIAF
jgi:hypothetical protein